MAIASETALPPSGLPGISHKTVASRDSGQSVSVWRQQIEPAHGTPPHRQLCDEVVTVQRGSADLRMGGAIRRLGEGDTVVLPANVDHQILNTGAEPLELIAVFTTSPVQTVAPDGTAIDLPGRS
jgi:mannose-6-phosphate isomerase-like protein (cupin superfamily)